MNDSNNNNKCADSTGSGTEHIKLRAVQRDNNCEILFKVKKTTRMGKLMKSLKRYTEHVGVPLMSLRFMFDGKRINHDDTPTQLEMKHNDVIQVFKPLTAGENYGI